MSETSRWIKPEDVPTHLANGWRLKKPVEQTSEPKGKPADLPEPRSAQ